MTIGTPLEAILDGRNALLAVGMNGEPLPIVHGFPARMIVPGLYGYVSATKWLRAEVTTFAADHGYWAPRGYAERAVKTASRIDVPRPFAHVRPAGYRRRCRLGDAPGIAAVQVARRRRLAAARLAARQTP